MNKHNNLYQRALSLNQNLIMNIADFYITLEKLRLLD